MIYASRFLRYDENAMRGPDVLLLQEELIAAGYHVAANGCYDQATAQAAARLQRLSNLPADGVVGPETWNALNPDGKKTAPGQDPLTAGPSILIDLNKRRLTFTINGKSSGYPVAIGKPSTPSPPGNWVIVQKTMDPGGPFGARWMRLSVPWGGYGIHGTNAPDSIGRAVSHGCIRMHNKAVIKIYDLAPIGTPVNIIGGTCTGRILKEGSRGNDVKRLQKNLKNLGYYNFAADGVFGSETTAAVKSFQGDHDLARDGIVGPYTCSALEKALDIANSNFAP